MMDNASQDGPGSASCPSRCFYLIFDMHAGLDTFWGLQHYT